MKRFKRILPWLIFLNVLALCCCAYPTTYISNTGDDWAFDHLHQIMHGMYNYYASNGKFPAAAIRDKAGKPLLSWRVAMLPYLEGNGLYKKFKLDEPWDSPHNIKLLERMPPVYGSFRFHEPGKTFYQVFIGPGTAFEKDGLTFDDFPDGLNKTLFVIEAGEAVPWTKPVDLEYDPNKALPPLKEHHGKPVFFLKRYIYSAPCFNAGFGDSNVYSLPFPIDEKLLRACITRNGGEDVPVPAK